MLLNPYRFGASALPLLDTYSGAVAAYSTARKLKATATNCMRVRRSSDNAQTDIGFSGYALDLSALLTHAGSASEAVVTLYDQVGTANLGNSTSGNQPLIVSSGSLLTVGTEGKACAVLDSTDYLDSSASQSSFGTAVSLTGNAAWSAFIVHKKTTNTAGSLFGWGNTGVALNACGYLDDGTHAEVAFAGANPFLTTVPSNNTLYLTTIIKAAGAINTSTSVYRNGSSVASTGHSTGTPNIDGAYPLYLGRWATNYASNSLQGSVQEFIIFAGDKSADRAAIEADINDCYGIW